MVAETLHEQCRYACQLWRENLVSVIPYSFIGKILGIDKGTVKDHYKCYATLAAELGYIGRRPLVSDEHCEPFIKRIEEEYHQGTPWTIADILEFIQERSPRPVDKNNLCHWLQRQPQIKSCRGVPMEDYRLAISPEAIADYLRNAIALTDGLPVHFIFNADEMGHQEWVDRHEQTCFVPGFHQGDKIGYPLSRAGKRITLFACIAADGSNLEEEEGE
jgi:hypothetical protein